MGLDMYLNKVYYVEKDKMKALKKLFKVQTSDEIDDSATVSFCVGYWRKVNQIHAWFVKNVQEGNDDCGNYEVSVTQLEDLLSTIKEVLENNHMSQHLLPPKSGCFFGSTELNEYYFEDLKYTQDLLEKIIQESKKDKATHWFEYHSSW